MKNAPPSEGNPAILLRDVRQEDVPIFFEQQSDPVAVHMAAFTAKDPTDRDAFMAHWQRIMTNPQIRIQTIEYDGQVAGHVLRYVQDGKPEVSYWIGRDYWGRGIATRALKLFIREEESLPLYARVAKDNVGSIRVLEKCGFCVCAQEKGYANARQKEIEEYVMILTSSTSDSD